MRVSKNAEERRNEILDAADALFSKKGFDKTTISDIIASVDVARGTIYYHFESKEDIMDALILRYNKELLLNAREVAEEQSIPVVERLISTIKSMNIESDGPSPLLEHMHKPQNALMHQKIQAMLLREIPPILAEIVKDGIADGLFQTPYPLESMELFVAYTNAIFDNDYLELTTEDKVIRIKAFIYNLERVLGMTDGGLAGISELFVIK